MSFTNSLFGNGQIASSHTRTLYGALTNRRIETQFKQSEREELLQAYSRGIHEATLQQATTEILRIVPRQEVDSVDFKFTQIAFDRQWWSVLAAETAPNVGFLEQNQVNTRLIRRGAGVRVHTQALKLPEGIAEFRELLTRQAQGVLDTMAVLSVRELVDAGLNNQIVANRTGTMLERLRAVKTMLGAGANPIAASRAISDIVAAASVPGRARPVLLIDPADIGALAPLANGIPIPVEDPLPRPPGVETAAGKPALVTPAAVVYSAPRGLRRAVRSDGTMTNAETSLMEVMVSANEYAVFPSDSDSATLGATRRKIDLFDHTNKSVRTIGFDDALRAGGLGDEVIRAGRSTGSAGADRSVPWNACHANGVVAKATVFGQLDEAIAPTGRIVDLARAMARSRTAGGATDFDRRVGDLNLLIGRLASAKVTPDFINRVSAALNNVPAVSNQTTESAAAGWVPMQQYAVLDAPITRVAADSDLPPGLLSAHGLEFVARAQNGWSSEALAESANAALGFVANFQSTLNQMVENNVFLGPAVVPQNLPKDLEVNGAALLHLLLPQAVPMFVLSQAQGQGNRQARIAFSETNFTNAIPGIQGPSANSALAPSVGSAYGSSDYAMRNGLVNLSNGTRTVTVPADVAYMYISMLPSIALAQRIPLTYLGRLTQIGTALGVTQMRKFSALVPKDQESALYLIDYVTSSGGAQQADISQRAAPIIAGTSSVEKLVEKQKALSPLPNVLATVKPTAGLAFGEGMETDFVQWQLVSKDGIPYLNRGTQNSAVVESVNNIVSVALSTAGNVPTDLSNNDDLRVVLESLTGSPRPARVAAAGGAQTYVRTDLMMSPAQAQTVFDLAQQTAIRNGTPAMLPGDPETGFMRPLTATAGAIFPVGLFRSSSTTAAVKMLAGANASATASAGSAAAAGSLFTPARQPRTAVAYKAGLSHAERLTPVQMNDIMMHPNMVARLNAVDSLTPSERLSALLLLGTRCDSNDALLMAHRNNIPMPFGLAVFRSVVSAMRSVVAVVPGEQTAVNAHFNQQVIAGMDSTVGITTVHATVNHAVVIRNPNAIATGLGMMPGRVDRGGSVDFVTPSDPGAGSLHVVVVPLGWSPQGDILLTDGSAGIPNVAELRDRLRARSSMQTAAPAGSFMEVLLSTASQAAYSIPTQTLTGTIMTPVPSAPFAHLAMRM